MKKVQGNKKIKKSLTPRLSTSDSALNTTKTITYNKGFPPGTTVDELSLYRRKKPLVPISDNLQAERGSYQEVKSEYNRTFKGDLYDLEDSPRFKIKKPEDHFKLEGPFDLRSKYYDEFIERPLEHISVRRPKDLLQRLGMDVVDEEGNSEDEEDSEGRKRKTRKYLFRHPTNLKLEGEFYTETENAEKFIEYLLAGARPELARTSTTLKMEGEMDTKTETSDKYVPFELQERPPLYKKSTNLHLEGVLDIMTENREKYLPFEAQPRPPLTKRSTNLHLEGDLRFHPEYQDVFVEYKDFERQQPKLPQNNLKTEGNFDAQTEKAAKFVEHQIHPVIPFLRGYDIGKKLTLGDDYIVKKAEYKEKFVEHPRMERNLHRKPKENLKPEGDMESMTENKKQFVEKQVAKTEMKKASNNLLLEGNIDLNPEYRNAYVNFYRDAYGKFGIKKDDNEAEARKKRTAHLTSEGKIDANPEYRSSYVDFPRQRPSVKKPEGHLHSEGNVSQITEKRAQFVEHPKSSKTLSLKRRTELKLEGPFECQPEYRRAYIDYITRERASERQPRPLDHLGTQPKRVFDETEVPIPIVVEKKEDNAKAQEELTVKTETTTAIIETKSKLPVPISAKLKPSRRSVSLSPTPRPTETKSKDKLSKIENSLFGPKVPNPSGRHSSKTEVEKRINEANLRARMARARRRYGSPVIVENLAHTPRASPVQEFLESSTRKKWQRDEDADRRRHAFVVLGSIESEISSDSNNNFKRCDGSRKVGYRELYKEQKWMPSWNTSVSK